MGLAYIPGVADCIQRMRHARLFGVGSTKQDQEDREAAMKIDRQEAATKIDRPKAAQQNRLLRSLPPADFALLAPYLTAVSLEQGQVLTEPGDFVEHVYFPHTAVISFLAVMQHGQTVETATIGRTGVVGGVSGLGRWRAFARVVVQVPGTASRIPSARFRAAFRQSDRPLALEREAFERANADKRR